MKTAKERYYEREKQKELMREKLITFENKHNYGKRYEDPKIDLPNWMKPKQK